jgi:hypothetical protein
LVLENFTREMRAPAGAVQIPAAFRAGSALGLSREFFKNQKSKNQTIKTR